MIKLYKNILPQCEFDPLYDQLCRSEKWSYSGRSTRNADNFKFWYLNLQDNSFYTNKLFQIICNLTNLNLKIVNVYANGQTYGCPGNLHYDRSNGTELTFLYYINPIWHVTWGGQTVFSLNNDSNNTNLFQKAHTNSNDIISYFPIPNSGLLFSSDLAHCGLDGTRHFTDLRITVAYKLKKI